MDGDHDATDIDDTNTSSDPPPEISVPHNFFINFSPELKTWLAQVLDGDNNDDFLDIQNLFDFINEFCKKACSLKQFLPVRICGDQWLRSEIMLETSKADSIDLEQAESPDILAGDNPLCGLTCDQALNYTSSESRETPDINIITQSNILPRQASLKKLLTSVAKTSRAKSLGMPLRILTNIAGNVHRTLGFDAIEDGDPRGTCTIPEGLNTDLQEKCKADVKLPVVSLPELWSHPEGRIQKGATGEVWKVIISQGVFAMKKFKDKELLRAEANIVEVLSHPHIVHTFGSTGLEDPNAGIDQLSLLMEFMEDDLSCWITSKLELVGPLDSLDILLQVAKAMKYMHGEQVVHGDLKPNNILISQFDISRDAGQFIVVKVADFGSAQMANSPPFSCKPGTTKWSPPEVLQCIKSKNLYLEDPFKADVYSFGLIAYEVLTGRVIFDEAPILKDLKEQIMANNFSQYFTSFDHKKDIFPESFISFMKTCWAFTPTERPSFHEIIEKIKEARSSLITRSTVTHVSKASGSRIGEANSSSTTKRLTKIKRFMKKVTLWKSMTRKAQKISNWPHPTQSNSSSVESWIPEDKSEIIERNNEVKKDLMITTKSLENSNFMPVTKSSNSTLGVRTTLRNAKRKVKNLGNKGGAKFKAYFGQKNTVEQVPPPPTQPISSLEPPVESRAQEDKGTKRKFEGDACKDGSEQVIKSNKKSKS